MSSGETSGSVMITIPADEYDTLLECRKRELARGVAKPARRWDVAPSSPLARDAEVIAFFSERIGSDVLDLLKECRLRFGAVRTPSRTAVYYLWKCLRAKTCPTRTNEVSASPDIFDTESRETT